MKKCSFKFDRNLNRKVWVLRKPDKNGIDEVASIDIELLFRKKTISTDGVEDTSNSMNRGQAQARRKTIKSSKSCQLPHKITWCGQWQTSLS